MRRVIAFMVLRRDPFAIALAAAISARRSSTVENHSWSEIPSMAIVLTPSRAHGG
jgi:hypothetical protein